MALVGNIVVGISARTDELEAGIARARRDLAGLQASTQQTQSAFAGMGTSQRAQLFLVSTSTAEATRIAEGYLKTYLQLRAAADLHSLALARQKEQLAQTSTSTRQAEADLNDYTTAITRTSDAWQDLLAHPFKFAGVDLASFAPFDRAIEEAAAKINALRNQLAQASGSQERGITDLGVAQNVAGATNTNLSTVVQQLATFTQATRGTTIEGEAALRIFTTLSEAQNHYGASAEQTAQILKIFESALSAGTFSQRQFQDLVLAFPRAADLMQQAFRKTKDELAVFLSKGVDAGAVVRAFTAQVATELPRGLDETRTGINRLTMQFDAFKAQWMEESWLSSVGRRFKNLMSDLVQSAASGYAEILQGWNKAGLDKKQDSLIAHRELLPVANRDEGTRLLELDNMTWWTQSQRAEYKKLTKDLEERAEAARKSRQGAAADTAFAREQGLAPEIVKRDNETLAKMKVIIEDLPKDWAKLNAEIAATPNLLKPNETALAFASSKAEEIRALRKTLDLHTSIPPDVIKKMGELDTQAGKSQEAIKAEQDAEAERRRAEAEALAKEKEAKRKAEQLRIDGENLLAQAKLKMEAVQAQQTAEGDVNAQLRAKEHAEELTLRQSIVQRGLGKDVEETAVAYLHQEQAARASLEVYKEIAKEQQERIKHFAQQGDLLGLDLAPEVEAQRKQLQTAIGDLNRYEEILNLSKGKRITPEAREFARAEVQLAPALASGGEDAERARIVLQQLEPEFRKMKAVANDFADSFLSTIDRAVTGGIKSFGDFTSSVIADLVRILQRQYLAPFLGKFVEQGIQLGIGVLGGGESASGSDIPGMSTSPETIQGLQDLQAAIPRASGGEMMPGRFYEVGEHGREIVHAGSMGGHVYNQDQWDQMHGGVVVNFTVYANDASSFKRSQGEIQGRLLGAIRGASRAG